MRFEKKLEYFLGDLGSDYYNLQLLYFSKNLTRFSDIQSFRMLYYETTKIWYVRSHFAKYRLNFRQINVAIYVKEDILMKITNFFELGSKKAQPHQSLVPSVGHWERKS